MNKALYGFSTLRLVARGIEAIDAAAVSAVSHRNKAVTVEL